MSLSRRRFLITAAALTGAAAVPFALNRRAGKTDDAAKSVAASAVQNGIEPTVWQGIALGSGAEMRLYHSDRKAAEALITKALSEVSRLEKIFSLYRDDSDISRLNREGRLNNPPSDLLAVLSMSRDIHRITQGAFDPTVQPLWNAYADYFRRHPKSRTAPPKALIDKALERVGLDAVEFGSGGIRFAKNGMALSLNGIAQGYITDRVTEMLRDAGIKQALIDLGEIRALDTTNSRTWQAGVRHPDDETAVLFHIPLQNQGLATSGGYGTHMDEGGKFTHLFDPRSGISTPRYKSVSVTAPAAATADALSTAFSLMNEHEIQTALRQMQDAKVWLVLEGNQIKTVG